MKSHYEMIFQSHLRFIAIKCSIVSLYKHNSGFFFKLPMNRTYSTWALKETTLITVIVTFQYCFQVKSPANHVWLNLNIHQQFTFYSMLTLCLNNKSVHVSIYKEVQECKLNTHGIHHFNINEACKWKLISCPSCSVFAMYFNFLLSLHCHSILFQDIKNCVWNHYSFLRWYWNWETTICLTDIQNVVLCYNTSYE